MLYPAKVMRASDLEKHMGLSRGTVSRPVNSRRVSRNTIFWKARRVRIFAGICVCMPLHQRHKRQAIG